MQIPAVRWRDVLDKGKKRQKGATTEKEERDGALLVDGSMRITRRLTRSRSNDARIPDDPGDVITASDRIEAGDLDLASFRGGSRIAIAIALSASRIWPNENLKVG